MTVKATLVICSLLVGCLAAVGAAVLAQSSYWTDVSTLDPAGKLVTEQLLNDWQKGEDGARYWVEADRWMAQARKLDRSLPHTVLEYRLIASGRWLGDDAYRYRIKSSNKTGIVVEKLWNIIVVKDAGRWRVKNIFEQ